MDNLLTLIRFLAEPFGNNCEGEDGQLVFSKTADSTESLWLELCKKVWDKVAVSSTCQAQIENTESSSSWKLTCTILDVLQQLKIKVENVEKNQSEEEKSIEVLSVQSQIYIQKCIEIVVGFGILPYYLPGVGMPDKFRKFSAAQKYWEADKMTRPVVQFHRLAHCLNVLIDLCQHSTFVGLILPHHVMDIMCGLIQICKSPVKAPKICKKGNEMDHSGKAKQSGSLSLEEYSDVMSAKEKMSSMLLTFYPIVPRRLWVHALLLIGAGKKPKWFITECAKLQYDQLLKENDGLLTITQAVMENLCGAQEWRADKIISNLVKAAWQNRNKGNDNEVFIILSNQSLSMIITSLKRKDNEPTDLKTSRLRDIGLLIAVVLTNINKEVAQRTIWDVLFEPVLRLNIVCEKNTETSLTFKQIEDCATFANSLLNIINHYNEGGICFEVRDFQPSLWSTLFQIMEACNKYEIGEDDQKFPQKESIQSLKSCIIEPLVVLKNMVNQNSKDVPTAKISKFFVDLIVRQTDVLKDFVIEVMNENFGTKKMLTESKALSFKLVSRFNGCRENGFQLLNNSCEMLVKEILSTDNQSTEEEKIAPVLLTELMSYNNDHLINEQHTGGKKADVKAKRNNDNYDPAEEVSTSNNFESFVVYTLMHVIGGNADVLETFIDKQQSTDPEKFLELIMNRLSTQLTIDSGNGSDFNQTIAQALGILECLCEAACRVDRETDGGGASYSKTDKVHVWKQLETFIPFLKTFIAISGLSSSVHQTAANILKCIESRGRISSFCGTSKSKEDEVKLSRYEIAMQEVESPLIYIKGHGLLELRKMLEENDEEALDNKENLLLIFQGELNNDDSYAYLMAIEGMAALGVQFHAVVIPKLIQLYDFPFKDVPLEMDGDEREKVSQGLKGETLKMTDEDLLEYRLKVGEILVKLMQRLGGEIAPLYRVPMANVCFRLIRDEDPAIKASALANLGELCHVLKFALANILTEVWKTVEIMLDTEKEIQVRRAGYHLMVLLLRGIAKELEVEFIVKNKDVGVYLRDARRLLTKMKTGESDEVSKCHIDLALAEIALIAAKFFMISAQATK